MPNIRFTPPPPPFISSNHALYFLTALTAAALLLFTLLANADDASAQQAVDNTPTSTSAPRAMTFSAISVGGHQSCGISAEEGAVVCWGTRMVTSEQTEYAVDPPSGETFTSISLGWGNSFSHICGLRADGAAVCWGYNGNGQATPPADETFTSITNGRFHTCGLRKDGTAVCWGQRGLDASPSGVFTSINAGSSYTCGLRANGAAVCWDHSWDYRSLTPPTGFTFTSISTGGAHACGLRPNGAAVCWGPNLDKQSTPPSGETFASISAGQNHTCGLRRDGTAVCWGLNYWGQSTPPSGVFTSISAGVAHTCGLRRDGTAACWGDNYNGQTTPPTASAPVATPIPTLEPTPTTAQGITPDPTHTPTPTSVSATDEPTPTPTSTVITDEPAPTLTPTATGESTPVGDGLDEFEEQVGALRDRAGTLQDMGTLNRLIESLRGLINALTDRVVELGGTIPTATPTHTPTPTNTPVTVLEATPTPTATSTSIPTATPTRASASTLAPGCIRKTGLGWLTGTWNADCVSDKTPATAKTGTRYARFYTFTLDAASTVTVSITSEDVADTYLYLLEGVGNAGSIVNRGDSRITEQLQAGSYTIEATTYNLQTAGNFMLTLDISTASVSR